MRTRIMKQLPLGLLFAAMLSACSGTYENKVEFNPQEHIRVAILPFVQVNSKGEIINPDPKLLIDEVDVISSELKETPAEYVSKLVHKELERSGLDVISPVAVEAKLLHNNFGKPDLSIDIPKALAAAPRDLCDQLLGCDAILYGKVKEWDRSYFAIQSSSTVAIELKLVSARDGKVLFSSDAKDSDSRGLSKGPTGFSDLVLEPLKGLDNKILTDLARRMVVKMLAPLAVSNRPDFLNTSPPAIYASAQDQPDGLVSHAGSLKVLAFGTPNRTASFSVGDIVQHVPMVQKDDGHYIGEYFPLPSDSFQNQPLYVFLTDDFGRTTRQKVGNIALSLPASTR